MAEFMCQSEDQASISEALAIITSWWIIPMQKSLPSRNNFPKAVLCKFVISIDYKQCTAGPSQRRMAFLAEQEIFLELMKSITYANAVDKFEK